ncbi:hypothetical protein HBO32_03615 [Pseudomonas nitroreducens]|uniref:hypothetical protein n=1 Tax=Pseudomonas TaxID=286 RepID=UPI0011471E0D|nr:MULTISPECIES: hypothetical protein [Pseudomonas]MDG9856771.1 hypothetical protein [Pseudomonas nitroreducens]NMZ72171.1 hypothetical protein [Pseudomonas nitroreducens]
MREAHDLVPDNLQPPQYGTGQKAGAKVEESESNMLAVFRALATETSMPINALRLASAAPRHVQHRPRG